jgi:phosphatidylglycerophosphate synthase
MWREVKTIFKQTILPEDKFWVRYASRPPAAVLVYLLQGTAVTANQVSFASIFFTLSAAVMMALWNSYVGLLAAIAVFHFSYVLDCVDGQLARIKKTSSEIGAYLDFLTDELRAYIFFAGVSLRLYRMSGEPRFLILGIVGMGLIAIGISLTVFIRRPEYGNTPAPSETVGPLSLLNRIGKFVIHYPSYVVYLAVLNLIQVYFYAYLAAYVLYVGHTGLSILLKLGRAHRD